MSACSEATQSLLVDTPLYTKCSLFEGMHSRPRAVPAQALPHAFHTRDSRAPPAAQVFRHHLPSPSLFPSLPPSLSVSLPRSPSSPSLPRAPWTVRSNSPPVSSPSALRALRLRIHSVPSVLISSVQRQMRLRGRDRGGGGGGHDMRPVPSLSFFLSLFFPFLSPFDGHSPFRPVAVGRPSGVGLASGVLVLALCGHSVWRRTEDALL
ncbi:hypothetical protein B0H13DRAFT_2355022 [Mycena leptocephala]|nr:hypothetical protein B0H13DRAFT_2355022 [Mycena leptocephala]